MKLVKVAPYLIRHHAMKTYGEWRFCSTHLWRWIVRFTPRPLYPRCPRERRLGEPQSWCERGSEKKYPTSAGNWTRVVQVIFSHYIDQVIPAVAVVILYSYIN